MKSDLILIYLLKDTWRLAFGTFEYLTKLALDNSKDCIVCVKLVL
jgi:hypothetical protein